MEASKMLGTLVDAILVAVGGSFVTGVILLIRWLISIGKQTKSIAEAVGNVAAVATATLEMQPPMTRAIRTIIEVTAEQKINGNVEKAHKELNRVEAIHDRIMEKAVSSCVDSCLGQGVE